MAVRGSSDTEGFLQTAHLGQIVILASWLGAAAFFSAVVAPAAFDVLPARELAGAVVGRLLPVLFIGGAAIGFVGLALEAAGGSGVYRRGRIAALLVLAGACSVAQFAVAPRLAAVRAGLVVPLASLPTDDPQRLAFGRLHMMSVAWLAVALLAGASAIALAVLTLRRRSAQ
jgi:hypothetical protein